MPQSCRALPPAGPATTSGHDRARPRPAVAGRAEDEGEGGCPAPRSRPPSSPSSAAVPSASPSVSPASRPPLRRARPLSGLLAVSPAGGQREPPPPPPPPPARSSASSLVPLASPHPREWPGGSQLAAGPPPPLPRCDQWAPATGKPRPPPGGGGLSRRPPARREGPGNGGRGLRPRPRPRCAAWTCHVGAAERRRRPAAPPGEGQRGNGVLPSLPRLTRTSVIPTVKAEIVK
ncbi:uncharacterized protein [Vicugna pacos]|uniref:Basic proline-rich protein-like n=1 Tax=Vicugna pacos TaxID=30538 RepID=A0ABM5DIH5_VICPA